MLEAAELSGWFEAHAAPLVLYARQWLPRPAAEDVVQEVFVRLMLQSRPPANTRAWLYAAVRNAAVSQWRSSRRHEQRLQEWCGGEEWFDPPSPDALDAEAASKAIAQLPALDREILVLRIWSGLKLAEIGRIVGIPVSTVFHHYQQSLAQVRQRMSVPCKTQSD